MTKVAVFIDYQNVYMRARELFAEPRAHFVEGQVWGSTELVRPVARPFSGKRVEVLHLFNDWKMNQMIQDRLRRRRTKKVLSRPLEDLMSPERASVLTVLERAGQPLSGRTIAALTGEVSQPTTSRLLIDLVQRGLVMKVPGGYELNRDHLAYRAIEALLQSRDELQRRVALDIATWNAPPRSVVLFGSAARGEETDRSDIDLLVVRPAKVTFDNPEWSANVATLSERVGRWSGSPCQVLEYSVKELAEMQRTKDPLLDSLLRDGITLAGVGLGALLAKASR